MAKIAFLGTGLMGTGMAGRLIEAGHELHVYNRTAEKTRPLVDRGAILAVTPRDAAEGADAVFAMVADDGASEDVWLGADGALSATLAPGAVCVECSTLSHDWVMDLAGRVQAEVYAYIDCPVTGYPHMAADGTLTLFAGATDNDLAAARPYLGPLSKEIIHFGGVGAGTAYKLMINLMGAVQIAAAAEGLLFAERAGLDRGIVADSICKGAAASPQVIRNATRMAADDHETDITFTGALRLKDTRYALALAEKLGFDAAFGAVAADAFGRQVANGLGDLSESKIIDVLGGNRSDT
jgi:3-hydroxyisobutyrate dehydrogenase